jgi:hypothetical protein
MLYARCDGITQERALQATHTTTTTTTTRNNKKQQQETRNINRRIGVIGRRLSMTPLADHQPLAIAHSVAKFSKQTSPAHTTATLHGSTITHLAETAPGDSRIFLRKQHSNSNSQWCIQ